MSMYSEQRPAEPGELCTCGREADVVFLTDTRDGGVGWCGVHEVPPILPCPFCGSATEHTTSYGDREVCPDYHVRGPHQEA